jgi:DNA repair protein SbcD/Mre11
LYCSSTKTLYEVDPMIRLLHTSDWHLGRLLYGKSLLDEQAQALDRLLELIDARKPDALLIAGDIFDRALPPEAAVKLFDSFCSRAVIERGLPVFVIPGNHDSAERIGFGSKLLRERGLTIYSRVEDSLSPVRLKGQSSNEVMIYGIPFVEPVQIARYLGNDELRTPDATVRGLVHKIMESHPKEIPSVLLCHAFVVGGEASESERDLFVGGSSFVAADAFEGFTYTALGHLHKPQQAGHESVRYSGSLLAYSKSEIDHIKSVTEIEIASDHTLKFTQHSLPLSRTLRYIEGEIETLLREGEKTTGADRDAYVIAGLTDSGPVLDALARLRVIYPNILHVSRAGGYLSSTLPALEKIKAREQLSELELFAEFFNETTGQELSAEERTSLVAAIESLDRPEDSPR